MFKRNITARKALFIATLLLFSSLPTACNKEDKPNLPPTETISGAPTAAAAPENNVTQKPVATVTTVPTVGPTATPTPFVSSGPLTAPLFSKEGGFYDSEFHLALTTTGTHPIYYTLDGSDPRTSETALLYENEISIYNNTNEPNNLSAVANITIIDYTPPAEPVDKGIIVRAVSKTTDGDFSDVVTNSYFVGKTAPYYANMKVLSLITDSDYLFDPEDGAYMVGPDYYTWRNSDSYLMYSDGDTRNPTNYNKDGRESEFPVTIQVFENGALAYAQDVGARIAGHWSRVSAQKSFRLYARKEYGSGQMKYAFFDDLTDVSGNIIQSFDKITLRNGGNDNNALHFRDALIHDLIAELSIDTMASEPCILFLNGEFWGFYLLREKQEDHYIESHYGIPKEEVSIIKNGSIDAGTENDLAEFQAFCEWAKSADMTTDENYSRFADTLDVPCFIEYMAVETYINNSDWANSVLNNWMVWRSNITDSSLPQADGKWRFLFYDVDISTGLHHIDETSSRYNSLGTIQAPSSDFYFPEILRNVMKNSTFREAFYQNYLHIINTCFAPDVVNKKITEYSEKYGAAILDTFYRFAQVQAAENFTNELEHLRDFFNTRPAYATQYLTDFYNISVAEQKSVLQNVVFWDFYGPATYLAVPEEHSFYVHVPEPTENLLDIQSQATDLTLEPYVPYQLTFEASCTTQTKIDLGISRQDGSDYPSCWWTTISLTPKPQQFSFVVLTDKERYTDWQLCFYYGRSAGDYTVKNVRLERIE